MTSRTVLSTPFVACVMLSFIGAKGCIFGGNVDMGSSDATAGSAAAGSSGSSMGVAGGMATGGYGTSGSMSSSVGGGMYGTSGSMSSSAGGGMGVAGGMATGGYGGSAGAATGEVPINIDGSGMVLGPRGIAGPFYAFSDGFGADGTSATGACELAGHAPDECASVSSPAPSTAFTNMGGVMCTSGAVETIIDIPGQTGCPMTSSSCDWANQWGAGIGFNLAQMTGSPRAPFNASAAHVIGIAFDLSNVPASGLRVMFPMPSTENNAHVFEPGAAGANYVSPVIAGHNRVIFATDLAQPDYVTAPVPFDPTQLESVQFLMPASTAGGSAFMFCVSNVSLIVDDGTIVGSGGAGGGSGTGGSGTGGSGGTMCPGGAPMETGFPYNASGMCLVPYADQLACPPPAGTMTATVPTTSPCAHRISDGALYVAIDHAMTPIGAQNLPQSDWARLSPGEWVDCNEAEQAMVFSASTCPIVPL